MCNRETRAMNNPRPVVIVQALRNLPGVLTEVVDDCTELVRSLGKLGEEVTTLVDGATEKINSLKHTEIDLEAKTKFEDALQDVYRCAMMCISSTSTFLSYGQDMALRANVKDGLEHDDLQPLNKFLGLLQQSMTHAKQYYTKFEELCKTAKKSYKKASEDCQHNSRKAQSKKIATRAIGGTAAATALAGGAGTAVALTGGAVSIAAGFFTFGVGTVVGLGITAAASAAAGTAVGAGAAVATHKLASDFKATEKKLVELAAIFDSMWRASNDALRLISAIEAKLELVVNMMDNLEYCMENDDSKQSISCTLELLFTKFSEISATLASHKEQMSSDIEARGYSEYI